MMLLANTKPTGLPKKVSHYRESSLNRIKIVNQARFFINFDYKISTRILYVRIKYSMHDVICDVINGGSTTTDKPHPDT